MIDKVELRKWWDVFVGDGNFTEVRILGRFSYSGYFQSFENLYNSILPYENMDDEQFYFVMNRIDEACYGRQQCEKIIKQPKITTNDNDLTRRLWCMIDFDPIRKSGTNSSEEEFKLAFEKAKDVYYFLKEKGFSEPVIANSGNGTHLQYRIDWPNDDESTELIKRFFKYLDQQFTDDKVEVDMKNVNAARLCKLYSTVAKKGANIPNRPWRESKIIYIPQTIETTPREKFEELAELVQKEDKPTPQRPNQHFYGAGNQFDLVTWLNQHGINYKVKQQGGSTQYTLEECPWIDSHSDHKKWDSALFQDSDGKITFNCQHSHCKNKTWFYFRQFYEPDAYSQKSNYQDEKDSRYQQRKIQYPIIKDETDEIGKKWLDLGDIEDVNLDDLPRIHTGFQDIDYIMGGGLFYSETTILSGINGSGKSAWLDTLALNAIQQNEKTALWTGELQASRLKRWIVQAASGTHVRESVKSPGKFFVEKYYSDKIVNWMHGKFLLYNNDYSSNYAQLLNDMLIPVKMGFKLLILDNLFAMDLNGLEGESNNKQHQLILTISEFAKKNNVHVILVAHPRKVVTFLRKEDILGSSALQNGVDNIFIIHRCGRDFEKRAAEFFDQKIITDMKKYGNVIEVCKNREFGTLEKLYGLNYNIKNRHFYDDRGEYPYGWEEQPVQATMNFEQTDNNEALPFARQSEDDTPF